MLKRFRKALIGLGIAAAVAAGALLGGGSDSADAGAAFRSTNCWYGQGCQVTWTSGPGSYYVRFTGVTEWGSTIQFGGWAWCGATNCIHHSTQIGQSNYRLLYVEISGPGYVGIAYVQCLGGW